MRFWAILLGVLGIVYIINHFAKNGFNIDLDVFNLLILCIGMLILAASTGLRRVL